MAAFIVDVNVAIVANGQSEQADACCQLFCVRSLEEVQQNMICLDDGDRILKEYRRHLSMSGQDDGAVGKEFMYWLSQNCYTPSVCERVTIREHPERGFEEFPDDPALRRFDRSDRKYVAVARASRHSPLILNAVDSDWRDYESELSGHGINVSELCPQNLREDR